MMLVSILIANYNYDRFLRDSIDSALGQSYPHVEVIVVDDGSTDDSREIIDNYGDRILPVMKENGGLASAANAGFAASRGDVICFLDADDVFFPNKVSTIQEAWEEIPEACLVYHQLQPVTSQKEKVGKPWPCSVLSGQIRDRVEQAGGWWPYPTTSGLSFSRAYLERMLPMPTGRRSFPDSYLAGPAAFFGPVIGVRTPLALSRFHGQNMSSVHSPRAHESRTRIQETARRGLEQYAIEFELLHQSLSDRLKIPASISLADHYPYQRLCRTAGDPISLGKVLFAAWSCPTLPLSMKLREVAKISMNRW